MTTYETMPPLSSYLAARVARSLARRKERTTNSDTNTVLVLVRVLLHVAGFALLTWSGFQWSMIAGGIVAGVSCFVMSTLFTSNSEPEKRAPDLRTGR
ncbi:MAG TPA: hypothetical protein VMP68_08880 [Candidatus Eisenbacteria bacterium]|nr:hypothetical protein [Candidatus Eisenbacteria bacterium]